MIISLQTRRWRWCHPWMIRYGDFGSCQDSHSGSCWESDSAKVSKQAAHRATTSTVTSAVVPFVCGLLFDSPKCQKIRSCSKTSKTAKRGKKIFLAARADILIGNTLSVSVTRQAGVKARKWNRKPQLSLCVRATHQPARSHLSEWESQHCSWYSKVTFHQKKKVLAGTNRHA